MPRELSRLILVSFCALISIALPGRAATTQPATKPAAFDISFATQAEGRAAIVDESTEAYFKLLQPLEMAAKTGSPVPGQNLAEQQANCRKRYQDAVQEFTPAEANAISWYVSKLAAYTYPKYPLLAATPWKFIKLSPQIEGDNPFTRGAYICLPDDVTEGMVHELASSQQAKSEWPAMMRFAKLLLHEQMHVVQRGNRERFAKFYTDVWGFTHAEKIGPNQWLTDHQMLDPDAVDQNWIYALDNGQASRWIWPLSILPDSNDASGPRFRDVKGVAVDLNRAADGAFEVRQGQNTVPQMTNLLNLLGFVGKFAPAKEIFNPNEASADLFSHVAFLVDVFPAMAPPEAAGAMEEAKQRFKTQHEQFETLLSEKK